MKNKICCLFSKLGDKLNNIDGEHYLAFFSVLSIIFLFAAMLLSPISASAADDQATMTLKAGTYRFNDIVDLDLGNDVSGGFIDFVCSGTESDGTRIVYFEFDGVSITLNPNHNPPNMTFRMKGNIYVDGVLEDEVPPSYINVYEDGSWGNYSWAQSCTLKTDQDVEERFGNWFIANTNYNDVNGVTPPVCPTLEEQIANYNGTWTEFLMMLRQNNRTLANSYQNNIDLAIQSGFQSGANSVTLEQRLSEFDGNWIDFERLMAEYNVDLQTMYTNYVNSLETQAFEDGNAYGQEIGYKNGYNSGLNKGQSDTFTKNFFTDFLGGVVEAIDSIHLYEHIREIDGGVSTVVEWYISPWTIFTSLICLIVVIIILKVWMGG